MISCLSKAVFILSVIISEIGTILVQNKNKCNKHLYQYYNMTYLLIIYRQATRIMKLSYYCTDWIVFIKQTEYMWDVFCTAQLLASGHNCLQTSIPGAQPSFCLPHLRLFVACLKKNMS